MGDTSFARSGALVIMRFTGAVREKFRRWTCRLVAANCRSPEEYILELELHERNDVKSGLRCLAAALAGNSRGELKSMMETPELTTRRARFARESNQKGGKVSESTAATSVVVS